MADHLLLARQLCGVPVAPGEIDALLEPGRTIARRIASANGQIESVVNWC
ncbi:MAG TPA: hypothetical protein VJL59_21850 [Anaerolineales bacterium]|nr:hypothetical protein [Anaerolineales bacterium]